MPMYCPFRVDLITLTTAIMNNRGDITHPCLTLDFTRKLVFDILSTEHLNYVKKAFISSTILECTPQCLKIFYTLSLWMLLKGFSKFFNSCLFHSVHCSFLFF